MFEFLWSKGGWETIYMPAFATRAFNPFGLVCFSPQYHSFSGLDQQFIRTVLIFLIENQFICCKCSFENVLCTDELLVKRHILWQSCFLALVVGKVIYVLMTRHNLGPRSDDKLVINLFVQHKMFSSCANLTGHVSESSSQGTSFWLSVGQKKGI